MDVQDALQKMQTKLEVLDERERARAEALALAFRGVKESLDRIVWVLVTFLLTQFASVIHSLLSTVKPGDHL